MNYHRYIKISFLIFIVLLSGCTTKYSQSDIYDYIEETYALEDVKVSKDRIESIGEDGYTDYVWEVSVGDIKFHVLDNYYWGMETLTNSLTDDYKDVMLKVWYEPKILSHFSLEENVKEGLYSNQLIAKFNTKEELIKLYEELEDFKIYLSQNAYDIPNSFSYHLKMQAPIRNNMPNYIIDDGDSYGRVTDITEDKIEKSIKEYILSYTDYHFVDLYDKFTKEEIIEAVKDSKYQIAIIKDESKIYYDDLCASRFGYGVSYGTLYEILKREGFDVRGNSEHYSFIDNNQNTYEISYDFINVDGKNDESNHYYYLKNDVPIKMEHNFYNHFRKNEIEEMCGLKLDIGIPE